MNEPFKAQKILDALAAFKHKMTETSALRSSISSRFDSELRRLQEEKKHEQESGMEDIPRSVHHMIYHDLRNGRATTYGAKRLFLDDEIRSAHIHKNRHYQWVLAEAYEAFEDFLEHLYAGIGYVDIDFWPKSDFGNIDLSDLSTKDFSWFLTQVALKKNKPNSILSCFRNRFKELREIETKNHLDCHVGFELCLISKLRHLIVHNSGLAKNKDEVIARTLKASAINEKDKEMLTAKANKFFSNLKDSKETHVFLLGHTDPTHRIFSTYNLSDLLGLMMNYAQILTEIVFKQLHEKGLITQSD
ncbi:hypothetical protein [Pseudomonas sp. MWU318]|uniref:hypothetical protein n=1 Tax=Pseudomonas sp. MWU318 TaxID=2802569 RepID=UPI001927E3A2|nr:hypothetical protein [Pseudomonas sp. MWU318]